MNEEDTLKFFKKTLENDPNVSEAVAAVQTLLECIRSSYAGTMVGLRNDLTAAIQTLTHSDHKGLITAIKSGCELFLRFITLSQDAALLEPDFKKCKDILLKRGDLFLHNMGLSRDKIARIGHPFVVDGATVLTHSRSRVVLKLLKEAVRAKKRFTVYVTESMPDKAGECMRQELEALNIPSIVILDAAVGYIMEKVDMVIIGAEGVVESGGIINKVGTYTMAVCAKEMHKPVYVVAESFKFVRIYPLNQDDVPNQFKYRASKLTENVDLMREHPMVDYTPPSLLTLLFTDLGILTPSAVSDELIKLYL